VRCLLAAALAITVGAACSGTQRWPADDPPLHPGTTIEDVWSSAPEPEAMPHGIPTAQAPGAHLEIGDDGVYRNTYYDFPSEGAGAKDATLYDAACAPIARVTQRFHDQVCVQGSGRLAPSGTVSFAKRDCACAAVCPRTGQKICFERLDPARFPSGRGATGGPIIPLRSVAVDTSVIPLGTAIYVPELVGLPRVDGSPHDGCFVAEDRGLKVVGRHLDVFTGDPSMTAQWNARVPSNQGVHVRLGDPRCTRR
jgi:3D (Asp-Asp-Asp) domain-containing protein